MCTAIYNIYNLFTHSIIHYWRGAEGGMFVKCWLMNLSRILVKATRSFLPWFSGCSMSGCILRKASLAGKSLRSFTFPAFAQLCRHTHVSIMQDARCGLWNKYPPLASRHLNKEIKKYLTLEYGEIYLTLFLVVIEYSMHMGCPSECKV